MSSDGFGADPQAIATAAKAFERQADPIAQQAQHLDAIKGSASTTGRAYHAQGSAYHGAITASLEKLIRRFAERTEWVSGALSQAGADYAAGDASGAQTITSSGRGA